MAEALGVSASIIAILQLSTTVINYINGVKEAKTERDLIFREIVNTRVILTTFKDLAESEKWGGAWSLTVTSLAIPYGPLDQFKLLLERLLAKLKPTSTRHNVVEVLVWPFRKVEVIEILNSIERLKSHLNLALHNDHISLSRALKEDARELKTGVEEIKKGVSNIQIYQHVQENTQHDEARRDILSWLSPLNFASSQNDVLERRQDGTGSWILEDQIYQKWLATKKTLWCTGIPGGR